MRAAERSATSLCERGELKKKTNEDCGQLQRKKKNEEEEQKKLFGERTGAASDEEV